MNIIEVKDYQEMSKKAAEIIISQVETKPDSVLGLATGGTPLGTYNYLVELYHKKPISYQKIKTVNLDEYVGLEKNHPQSYTYYMNKYVFSPLQIPKEHSFLPFAAAITSEESGKEYEQLIEGLGGVDLQILGIGENGHIGFNEPGTSFDSITSVVKLMDSTRKANARFFSKKEEVPTHAISMGISTIMKSKRILLLVSGASKAKILSRLFESEITEELPASVLKKHANVTLIADQEAMAIYKQRKVTSY